MIDLNLLAVLHAVLEEGTVARAAKRLHVTPPAVSNALARLRAALGDPLFVRSGRTVAPTPRALELAPVLARALGDLERAARGAAFDPASSTREFAVALADADQIATLPRVARAFARRLPRARLRVVSVDALVAGGGLARSGVDLAIGPGEGSEGLRAAPLYEEEAVFVVRRGHPRVGARLAREAFNAERHVDVRLALGRGGFGHGAAERAFGRHGLTRDVAVTVPTFAAAAAVAASTDLVAGLPRRLLEVLGGALPLVAVEGPGPPLRFSMQMLWHERTHLDPAAACLREVVAGAFRRRAPRAPEA